MHMINDHSSSRDDQPRWYLYYYEVYAYLCLLQKKYQDEVRLLTRNNVMDVQQLIDLFFLQPKICNLLSQKKYEQNLGQ